MNLPDLSFLSTLDANPGLVYAPGPTISGFVHTDHPRALLRAPNQIGKSLGGAKRADLASRGLLACVPQVPNKGLVMIADLDNHYAEVCGKAWDVIDRPSLHVDCKYIDGKGFYTHGRRLVKYANGSTWTFRSGEGAVMAVAGGTFDWGWGDEIPNRPHFSEFMRGLAAKRAPAWLTLTPIGRPVGWYRERIEGDEDYREALAKGLPPESCPGIPPREEWLQFVPRLSVEECWWRTQESIDTQIAGMDPAEVPQRRDGAWEGLAGDRWFTGFGADSIVESVPRMSSCSFGVWMDHGENAGHQFAVLVVWRDGEMYAIDEYINPRATKPMDDAEAIVAMLARHGLRWSDVDSWVGDVNSSGKSEAGSSVNAELADAIGQITGHPKGRSPVRIDKPYKGPGSVQKRIRVLHGAILKGELLIHARCRKLIACLSSHHGDEDTKHGIDALGYGAVSILEGWQNRSVRAVHMRGR